MAFLILFAGGACWPWRSGCGGADAGACWRGCCSSSARSSSSWAGGWCGIPTGRCRRPSRDQAAVPGRHLHPRGPRLPAPAGDRRRPDRPHRAGGQPLRLAAGAARRLRSARADGLPVRGGFRPPGGDQRPLLPAVADHRPVGLLPPSRRSGQRQRAGDVRRRGLRGGATRLSGDPVQPRQPGQPRHAAGRALQRRGRATATWSRAGGSRSTSSGTIIWASRSRAARSAWTRPARS